MAQLEAPPRVERISTEDLRNTSGIFKRASTGQIRAVRSVGALLAGEASGAVVKASLSEDDDDVAPLPSPGSPLSPRSPVSPGYPRARVPGIDRSESVTIITSINKRVKFNGDAGQVPWVVSVCSLACL